MSSNDSMKSEDFKHLPFSVLLDEDAVLPTRSTPHSAGFDLSCMYPLTLQPFERVAVSTGVAIVGIPGIYLRIAPRSGLALKHGIDVMAGVIDADYRGEIKVLLINLSNDVVELKGKTRIAQMIPEKYATNELKVVSKDDFIKVTPTTRGEDGFGSTGLSSDVETRVSVVDQN